MKRIAGLLLLTAGMAFGQTSHSVVLDWTPAVQSGTITFNVYRVTGACPSSFTLTGLTPLVGGLSASTYTDTTVSVGQYCYAVTAVSGTLESGPSPDALAAVTPFPPTGLTVVVH
jgi:hypothetical protein